MTEAELRTLVRRSEREGFRAVYQEYKGYVYTIIWNRIGACASREDAEEAVSDVFADVFRSFDSIREGSLQGYIGTLARRTAIDRFRRLSSRPEAVSLDEDESPDLPDDTDIPAAQERAELRQRLLACIESLGQPDASIILEKYYYDRSYAEIARHLRMQPAAVRMRAGRALKRLKRLLGGER